MADVTQQPRAEVNEAISGRMDMLNSINTALQNVSARTRKAAMKKESSEASYRTCTCGCKRGQIKESRCLPGSRALTKFDNNVIAVDCPAEEFRSIEASLYQVLHRTTSNEPLRIVPQTRGQKGFEAWYAIVRRYDQRNM